MSSMSEKGVTVTGLKDEKEEEERVTGLKEEEEQEEKEEEQLVTGLKEEKEEEEGWVVRFKHLKVMCVKGLLDVFPVLYFLAVMFGALSFYRQTHIWWPALVLASCAIFNFWNCRRMKHAYIQHTLASADSDLSTTLLASSKK